MGKILIGISIVILAAAVSLILIFSETLGLTGMIVALGASTFAFFCSLYAGLLGIKYEHLQKQFLEFVDPLRIRYRSANLIKAVCPLDHKHVVFVHVSPHRDDARPDGLDIFLGSCGHEVHRGEIEEVLEEPEPASA